MKRVICTAILCAVPCILPAQTSSSRLAANPQDVTADVIANAFTDAQLAAHLAPLNRMGRNIFGDKVCKDDLRMPSGLIDLAKYETSDPLRLPEAAQRLAMYQNSKGSRRAVRYGVGVCSLLTSAGANATFAVVIAIYESRWDSFVRIFWE